MSILFEKKAGVARVTLNRPEVRNAFDEAAIAAVTDCFLSLAKDKGIRATVIRGKGPDFCAGADIGWMRRAADYKPAESKKDSGRLVGMYRAIDACPVPVIVGVHGGCFGGGLGIVASSDIAVAASGARLAFSECRLGIVPAIISSFVLPKIGSGQARRYYLTAEAFGAEAALRMGLVHEVAPESELDARIEMIVQSILKAGPLAVREAKAMIRKASAMPFEKRVRYTVETLARIRATAEAKEGLSAFLEKRPPAWAQAADERP